MRDSRVVAVGADDGRNREPLQPLGLGLREWLIRVRADTAAAGNRERERDGRATPSGCGARSRPSTAGAEGGEVGGGIRTREKRRGSSESEVRERWMRAGQLTHWSEGHFGKLTGPF